MAPSSPAETQGRDIFPMANGCSRFPQSGQLHPSGKAWVFFPIGKSLCWERSRFPGLAAKPTGTAAVAGGWGGDEMQAPKSTCPRGGGWLCRVPPPTLRSFSRVMHPCALGHLDALPACPPGSTLVFPLILIRWAKKSHDLPADLVGKALAATVGDGNHPRSPGNSSGKHPSEMLTHSEPFPFPAKGPFPSLLLRGGAVALLVSHPLVFHTQFLFCMISAWPGVRFLCVSRK